MALWNLQPGEVMERVPNGILFKREHLAVRLLDSPSGQPPGGGINLPSVSMAVFVQDEMALAVVQFQGMNDRNPGRLAQLVRYALDRGPEKRDTFGLWHRVARIAKEIDPKLGKTIWTSIEWKKGG